MMLASLSWSNRPYADSRAAGSSHSRHIKIGCWLEKGWQINSQFLDHKAAGNVSEYNGERRGGKSASLNTVEGNFGTKAASDLFGDP